METTKLLKSLALALAFAGPIPCLAQPSLNSLSLPKEVEQEISKIVKIKTSAMSFPSMRSVNGELGKQAEVSMDRLGAMLTDEALIQQIRAHETGDIRAKIALWAVDRKVRPEEYRRFPKFYVNKPPDDEAGEYFYRPHRKEAHNPNAPKYEPNHYIPRAGAWLPNEIDKEDRVEENRLIMEYHFFIPPTGQQFDRDWYRGFIADGLCSLNETSKSLVVMIKDAEISIASKVSNEEIPPSDRNEAAPLSVMARTATEDSFRALSEFWKNERERKTIQFIYLRLWPTHRMVGDSPDAERKYDIWQELAKRDWVKPAEKEFATWLKTVPSPKPAQYTDDPNNPFLPLRPVQK